MDDLPPWRPDALAERLGISRVSTRRWRRAGLPAWARIAIRLLFGGELGLIHPAWRGWVLRNGQLCGPDGFAFEPREILALPFLHRLVNAYQVEQRVDRQADWVSGRYETQRVESQDAQTAAEFARPAPAADHSYLAPVASRRRRR